MAQSSQNAGTLRTACDRCYELKARCQRASTAASCAWCERLGLTCTTVRPVRPAGRRVQKRTLPVPAKPSKDPEIVIWLENVASLLPEERELLIFLLGRPENIDRYVVCPSFQVAMNRSLVTQLLLAVPILKDSYLACASALKQLDPTLSMSTDNGVRHASSAMKTLLSLPISNSQDAVLCLTLGAALALSVYSTIGVGVADICHYCLTATSPFMEKVTSNGHTEPWHGVLVLLETMDCLVHRQRPTLRFQPRNSQSVDRHLGLCSPLLPYYYDLCIISHSLVNTTNTSDLATLQKQLDEIHTSVEAWIPSHVSHLTGEFGAAEIVVLLAQVKVYRLGVLLVIHRLRHAFGVHDEQADIWSKEILMELEMAKRITKRPIRYVTLPFLIAAVEIREHGTRNKALQRFGVIETRKSYLAGLVLPVLIASFLSSAVSAEICKCVPSDPCWPSSAVWNSFNTTISGRLIQSVPPAAVCYPSRPEYDQKSCGDILEKWTVDGFYSSDPITINGQQWAGDSCNPIYSNGTSITGDANAGKKGCSIGMYPHYVVNATEASHVQAAVKFAKANNIRLIIKNTGHRGSGKNTGYGSLSIWTHYMKNIEFHKDFKPQGCFNGTGPSKQMAATLGAGVQDGELFAEMANHDAIAVGGTNNDVGVVGWASGGGHGLLTGTYGNGADNIIEATIVTPDGKLITANSCQNTDIFWAIRGGGGATFGVVLNVTVKAFPMPYVSVLGFDIYATNSTSSTAWFEFVAKFISMLAEAQDSGFHGYWTMGGDPSWALAGAFFLYNTPNDTVASIQEPILQFLSDSNETVTHESYSIWAPSWYQLLSLLPSTSGGTVAKAITASRLLTKRTLQGNQAKMAETLEFLATKSTAAPSGSSISFSGTMTISSTPVDNALNPAWRDAAVHLIVEQHWDDSTPTSRVNAMVDDMTYNKLNALRELDPGTGAYLNEANDFEPGWQWSFFGSHYRRLHAIKAEYDPEDVLWCPNCVGSEAWVQTHDGLLCRAYQPLKRI
ncbi:hypothetical protein GQX73_g9539 [Xylaria multiplex]|uniref:FAD-binding PCMH-type domain-containing protein n=1 Tax=Xylaria multiplex TaxID=323545 RepID=A0A7C8IML6_9PEZI|nr:hypothetical protein GQX73_g9539 [Xylaria multiplex]